jgi:hypothetical protein
MDLGPNITVAPEWVGARLARPKQPAPQTKSQVSVGGSAGSLMQVLMQGSGSMSGWGQAPPPGMTTWRQVRRNPTVVMARVAAFAPVKMAMRRATLVADDDRYVDDAAALSAPLKRLMRRWLPHGLTAVDYGWSPAEIVWGRKRIGRDELEWPVEIKPLLQDLTEARVDQRGKFVGLRNRGVELDASEVLWVAHEPEAGSPYGTARCEIVRRYWWAWTKTIERMGQYAAKVAGVTPIIEYPEGESPDESGRMHSNYDLAVAAIASLGSGFGVALPNALARYVTDLAQHGIAAKEIQAWGIRFLEAGAHGEDMVKVLTALDRFLVRGYSVPERAVLEGEHGTKADSEVHVDIVMAQGDDIGGELGQAWDDQVVDEVVRRNFGEEAVGVFRTEVPALQDAEAALVRSVVRTVLTTPATLETFGRVLDMDSMIEQQGLPLLSPEEIAALPDPEPAAGAGGDGDDELSRVARGLGEGFRPRR